MLLSREKVVSSSLMTSTVTSLLKDVLDSLLLFGIGPFEAVETVKDIERGRKVAAKIKGTKRSRVFWVLLHLWLGRLLFKMVMMFFGKGKVGETGVEFLRTMAATYAFNRMVGYRARICHLFWSLDRIENDPPGRLPQYARIYTRAVWAYLVLRVAVDIFQLCNGDGIQTFVEKELLIESIDKSWEPVVFAAAIMDKTVRRLMVSGITTLLIDLFVELAWIVAFKFHAFDDRLKRYWTLPFKLPSPEQLRQIRFQHADLCLIVQDMDDIFSPLAFLWHAMLVLGSCSEVTHLMQFDPYEDVVATAQFSLDMLYMLVCFVVVSFSAAAVCEAHNHSLPLVNRMAAAHCTAPTPNADFLEQAFLFGFQMHTRDVSLTAWKFYDLNRAALVTTGGAVATYVVVVLQMAPTFMEGSKH